MEEIEGLRDFPRKHPDCNHCGTILAALTEWDQHIHDTCPCICHTNSTTEARAASAKNKRKKKK